MWRDNSFECFYQSNASFFGHYTYCDSIFYSVMSAQDRVANTALFRVLHHIRIPLLDAK